MGMLTFDLRNLEQAPQDATLELTCIGHRVNSGEGTAHVGVATVDTSKCTNAAPTCGANVATWATRPSFTLAESDAAFAEDFNLNVADRYTSDSMVIAQDKKRTVDIDVKALIDAQFAAGQKMVTFMVGETNGVELRFASSEGAGGMLGGLQPGEAPKLKVTVPDVPEPGEPTGPRAWDEQSKAMAEDDVLW